MCRAGCDHPGEDGPGTPIYGSFAFVSASTAGTVGALRRPTLAEHVPYASIVTPPPENTLCYGDCLDWMGRWDDATVDLIYLDPPFNSNATYNVLYAVDSAGGAQTRAFNDTWAWDAAAGERLERFRGAVARPAHKAVTGLAAILGDSGMLAYLTYMAERLEPMRQLLKPTGALCLHCDPTAAAYLKVLLDGIFGVRNFRNEIVWKRTSSAARGAHKLAAIHDVVLFYATSPATTANPVYTAHDPAYVAKFYRLHDQHGSYQMGDLTAAGTRAGDSGQPWRGIDPTGRGRHWAGVDGFPSHIPRPDDWNSLTTRQKLDRLDELGLIVWPQGGSMPRFKRYLSTSAGQPMTDMVLDVPPLSHAAKERLGYPTQKPRALLERILMAFSKEGDLVLDPFCGCGTTVAAARELRRRWCGIDISPFAIDLITSRRLQDPAVRTLGIPTDFTGARKLAAEQPFEFETWAVSQLPGFAPNIRQRGDGGIDGRATLATTPDDADTQLALAQVKGGRFSASYLRDFRHVLDREKAALGCFITLDPAPAPQRAAAKLEGRIHVQGRSYDRLHMWSIAEFFPDLRPPILPVMKDPYTGRSLDQPALPLRR